MLKILRFYVVVTISVTGIFMVLDSAGLSPRVSQGVPLVLTAVFVLYWRLLKEPE